MQQEHIDEILEAFWLISEKTPAGEAEVGTLVAELERHHEREMDCIKEIEPPAVIRECRTLGLLSETNEKFRLTEKGKERASNVIRRHRLAETLFTDVLDLPDNHAETAACKLEHIISEEITDSVCSFLGHPPLCPHGKPIPRGHCCSKFITTIKPIVIPLSQLAPGEEGSIVFISSLYQQRLSRLSGLGILPGARVRLIQKLPSFVITLAENQIALDAAIVSEIYVRKGGV